MRWIQLSTWSTLARPRSAAFWATFATSLVGLASASTTRLMASNSGSVTTVSAANYDAASITPESIVASFGTMLATTTAVAGDADPDTPGVQLVHSKNSVPLYFHTLTDIKC